MDSAVVAALARVLDDFGNQRIDSDTAKSQIANILSGKSPAEVLQELDVYVLNLPGNEKGKAALIVIMALLRLDLNSGPALAQEIQSREYKLAGHLYGGLTMLLNGRSRDFTFQLSVLDREAKNVYAEIEQWNGRFFWPHVHLFLTVKLLHRLDPCRFERLTQEDPSGAILLSMAQGHLPVSPSDVLLKKLLESSDPVHPNFALAFYAQPISILCGKIEANRGDRKKLNEHVDRCLTAFRPCSPDLRAKLLTNYLLVYPRACPDAFARQLVGAELQGEFASQITEPGKIRTIRELGSIASLIVKTPACDEQKHRITKRPLADAVLSVLIRFVQERTGIYAGDNRWLEDARAVLHLLTVRQKRRFGCFLNSQDRDLMISPLDKLVRFDIYLKDIQHHKIIQSLQGCLADSP